MSNHNFDQSGFFQKTNESLPNYNPDSRMYDFVYEGTRIVRICSNNNNFITDFVVLSMLMPSLEFNGFEITINRATNGEVCGKLEKFKIGQLSDPILVPEN